LQGGIAENSSQVPGGAIIVILLLWGKVKKKHIEDKKLALSENRVPPKSHENIIFLMKNGHLGNKNPIFRYTQLEPSSKWHFRGVAL